MNTRPDHVKESSSEGGFALVAAIIACLILMALAMLVISLSTGDLRTTTSVVGGKRAMLATESGVQLMTQTFNPIGANFGLGGGFPTQWFNVDTTNDPGSQYRYFSSVATTPMPLPGYSTEWGMLRFNIVVDGRNTLYNSQQQVFVGAGYGPVPIDTMYK
jgi:hypothetical protein